MLQILSIMLFENPIKFTLLCSVFLPLCSDYAPFIPSTFTHNVYHVRFTATFLLHAKSTTFRALSLFRIVGVEVGFSSPSLTFFYL